MYVSKYYLFAKLFDYPDKQFISFVEKTISEIQHKLVYNEMVKFYNFLPQDNINKIQELYILSFDVQSITTLDLGYVLFGDDYKRGETLALLNKECKKFKINCGYELSDYLPNILKLIYNHDDDAFLQGLVMELVVPALYKMIGEFTLQRDKLRKQIYKKHYKTLIDKSYKHIFLYRYILRAIYFLLNIDFKLNVNVNYISDSFLVNIKKELNIERF